MLTTFFIRVLNDSKDGYRESEELRPHLEAVVNEFDSVLKDAGDYHATGKISEQVIAAIQTSDVIFLDANSTNENVWYEIGFADRTNAKKVVCLYKRGRVLPFDRVDMRSIQYDTTDLGFDSLRVQLTRMLADLLCDKRLRDLLRQPNGPRLAADYLSSKKLRKLGIEWLIAKVRNTHEEEALRLASLETVAALGSISADLLTELLQPHVQGRLRAAAYQQAAKFGAPLPDEVWVLMPELPGADASEARSPEAKEAAFHEASELLKAYCFALVKHWLNGHLDPARVRDIIVDSSERGIRSAILTAIQMAFETNPVGALRSTEPIDDKSSLETAYPGHASRIATLPLS